MGETAREKPTVGGDSKIAPVPPPRGRDALGGETEGETQARERKERTWGRQRPPEGEGTAEGRRGGEEGPEWERERKDLRPRAPERKDQGLQGGAGRGKLVKINIYKLRVSQFFLHFRSKLCISYLLREPPRQGRGGSFMCSPHFPPHPPPLPLSSPPPPHVLPSLLFPSHLLSSSPPAPSSLLPSSPLIPAPSFPFTPAPSSPLTPAPSFLPPPPSSAPSSPFLFLPLLHPPNSSSAIPLPPFPPPASPLLPLPRLELGTRQAGGAAPTWRCPHPEVTGSPLPVLSLP